MPTYEYRCPSCGQHADVVKPMRRASEPEYCTPCFMAVANAAQSARPNGVIHLADVPLVLLSRVYTPPLRAIIRPSGYRLKPGDRGYDDFRRELALGEIKDDPTPVANPADFADFDSMADVAFPADPARDAALAQVVHQHWTEDLSDDTVRRRELAAAALANDTGVV